MFKEKTREDVKKDVENFVDGLRNAGLDASEREIELEVDKRMKFNRREMKNSFWSFWL